MSNELPFELRYVTGRVRAIFVTAVDFDLEHEIHGMKVARVYQQHWPSPSPVWKEEDAYKLFLYDFTPHENARHCFASLLWADPTLNPWHARHMYHPHHGEVVAGEVIRNAGQNHAIVLLEKSHIEALLDRRAVPHGTRNPLSAILPVGLRLRACITAVDSFRCQVVLSVMDWLAIMASNETRHLKSTQAVAQASGKSSYIRYLDAVKDTSGSQGTNQRHISAPSQVAWHGYRVLIIDDMLSFSRNVVAWLHLGGAQAWAAQNATEAEAMLQQQKMTHILLDYNIGDDIQKAACMRLLQNQRQQGCRVCLISASEWRELRPYAKRFELGMLSKPLGFTEMDAWLRHNITPRHTDHGESTLWQRSALPSNDQAEHWLKAVCQHSNAMGALWLRSEYPGFSVVATQGLPLPPDQNWLMNLSHSVVNDVISSAQLQIRSREEAGRLRAIWPAEARHVLAFPLTDGKIKRVEDILLIFSTEPFSQNIASDHAWQLLLAWQTSIESLEGIHQRLQEESVFAVQGRTHAAALHELRHMLQPFRNHPQQAMPFEIWAPPMQRALQIIDGGLKAIKPGQYELHLQNRIRSVFDEVLWSIIDIRKIPVLVHLPAPTLRVNFPAEVFEHCLINLVDNATKFCKGREDWASVEVRLDYEPQHKLPLSLTVRDFGNGLTPDQVRTLFLPRHSSGGFGMGLYVVHSIVVAIGGELNLMLNERWSGCTFECRFPLYWGEQEGEQ